RLLQEALLQAVQRDVEAEKNLLLRAGELLDSWASESELKDILTLDTYRRQGLFEQAARCERYPQWRDLVGQFQTERERLFNKYQGYFEGQQQDMDNRKGEAQKRLKPLAPKIEEARQKRDQLTEQQLIVNYYYQQSTHYLVIGLGSLLGLTLVLSFSGIWGGWLWGLIMGSTVFSYLASRYAYVDGKPMQDLYDFLLTRYPVKNIKPFFRYEDPEKPEQPSRFDASRADVLSQILQKDIVAVGSEFTQLERQRDEQLSYLQYLEGRKQWAAEQIRRMHDFQARCGQAPEPAAEAPVLVVEHTGTGELSMIPPLASEPEPEAAPAIALPVGIPPIEPKAIAGRKVRASNKGPLPERAS
ncbi:MAG: hypothetical protein CVV27_07610, partial [Candidatus Melainabacteria bacterium HGW-Melainabacteria-1]